MSGPSHPIDRRTAPRPNRSLIAGVVLFSSVVLGACDDGPDREALRNGTVSFTGDGVLVIAVDGLRWDHTSLSGYDRDTTPFLASLAKGGMVFEDTWSPTPSLAGSHVAILSGSDPALANPPSPREVGIVPASAAASPVPPRPASWFIPTGLRLLGQPFLAHGWNTAAFVDHPMIAELRGFDKGFRSFVEYGGARADEEREIGVFGVGRRFVRWVNERSLEENWFAYLHMNDLERVWVDGVSDVKTRGVDEATAGWRLRSELDFVPPIGLTEPLFHVLPPSRANRERGVTVAEYEIRYDRGLRALDTNMARIVGHAEEYGRKDQLTIVIVGSFGMGLGEHGLYLRAGLVEEEDLRVPLLIRPSRKLAEALGWAEDGEELESGGRRSGTLASLADIAPTLLELHGLPGAEDMMGLSLRAAMASGTVPGVPGVVGSGSSRARIFASSAMPPGEAVVEKGTFFTSYRPFDATPELRRSWQLAASSGMGDTPGAAAPVPVEASRDRFGGPGEGVEHGEAAMGAQRATLREWKSLLLLERGALHFGSDFSDRPPVSRFRALQTQRPN